MPSEGLKNRIKRVKTAIDRLKELSRLKKNDFFSDFRNIDSTERNFQVAIEGLLDIGNFIISQLDLESPTTYKDVGKILTRFNLISPEMGQVLSEMAGFRNLLVHGYAIVSEEIIFDLLKNKVKDLIKCLNELISILDTHNIDP